MTDFKYILFDLDGTISDPKVGITKAVAYALKHFGIDVENLDDLCKFIGPPLTDSFVEFYGFDETKTKLAVEKYREYFSVSGLYENTAYPLIEELLQGLIAQGKTLIIATSKLTLYAIRILEHFDLLKYFSFVAGSELDGTRSRKGEVVSFALQQNNITDLSSAVMIGDRKHDVIGAKEAGISSIGILYGYGDRAEHEQACADFIIDTIPDLISFFSNKQF